MREDIWSVDEITNAQAENFELDIETIKAYVSSILSENQINHREVHRKITKISSYFKHYHKLWWTKETDWLFLDDDELYTITSPDESLFDSLEELNTKIEKFDLNYWSVSADRNKAMSQVMSKIRFSDSATLTHIPFKVLQAIRFCFATQNSLAWNIPIENVIFSEEQLKEIDNKKASNIAKSLNKFIGSFYSLHGMNSDRSPYICTGS
jgi:hypothetical protein